MPLPKIWNDYDRLDAADLNADTAYLLARSGDAGAVFPAGPAIGDRFFRTDLRRSFSWDGIRWSTDDLAWQIPVISDRLTATYSGSHRAPPPPLMGGSDTFIVEASAHFYVQGGTALGASNKWIGVLSQQTAAAGAVPIATWNVDSGAVSSWRRLVVPVAALLGPNVDDLEVTWTKTGTPGNLYIIHSIRYRGVAV